MKRIKVDYCYTAKVILSGSRATDDGCHVETLPAFMSFDDAVKKALYMIDEYDLVSVCVLDAETGEILIDMNAEEIDDSEFFEF